MSAIVRAAPVGEAARPGAYRAAEELFRPIFDRIAAGAIAREQARRLPFEEVSWLKRERFGALRVPVEFGGYGLDHAGYLKLLIALAAADSNVAHLLRGHFAVVEEQLNAPEGPGRTLWLQRLGRGDIVGNASTEPGDAQLGRRSTTLTSRGGRWLLNGTKFYTTGSIFADWIDVSALREDEVHVSALAPRDHPGVTISDDWDGFGQRLTGTGTGAFSDVPVETHGIRERDHRLPYLGAFYQAVLLVVAAGIARAVAEEAGEALRVRRRVYSQGNADLAHDDPQLQQVVGELGAAAFAAEALVLATTGAFSDAEQAARSGDGGAARMAAQLALIEVSKAQVAIADIVPRAATRLFDALGASAVRHEAALDRHWRNARTVLSHNPHIYRARMVGARIVNGTLPDLAWSVGIANPTEKGAAA